MIRRRNRLWFGVLGAVLVPFMLMTGYAVFDHFVYPRAANADIYGYAVCIVGGLLCVWVLPLRAFWRCLLSIAYVPACFYPLAVFQLLFASFVFGERF
jgi:ascorbate-specific PTS system EIIC-type component UlaA